MLSKKLTLSLTFLVMVLAIGLVVTPTFGHDKGGTFAVTFTPGELMDDVSTVDHADITDIQVESGRDRDVTVSDGCSQWSNWDLV